MALLAAVIGFGMSSLDNQTAQQIKSSLSELAGMLKQTGLPESQEAADGIKKAADTNQTAAVAASEQFKGTSPTDVQSGSVKAFHNKLPEDCYWEKVIDPSTGQVVCSVHTR